ncbi:MAG: hypothetical protein CVU36_23600 [Betaproteobacteria bacterium HGW-Betaproteobacteria-9]|jgi:DNA-binding MarR family transcriptional regulator|nr:MAG: hypothetical protein CVU36_23600 [Betaproteobacteria bacterium HGW-Betaproteobacteria-9]
MTPRTFFQVMQVELLVRRRIETCLQAEKLTPGQYSALNLLGLREPASSAEMSRRLGISAQSMGEQIKLLEAKGLVERHVSSDNRRVAFIRRTDLGKAVLARCEKLVDKTEKEFFSPLMMSELSALKATLDKLRKSERERLNAAQSHPQARA